MKFVPLHARNYIPGTALSRPMDFGCAANTMQRILNSSFSSNPVVRLLERCEYHSGDQTAARSCSVSLDKSPTSLEVVTKEGHWCKPLR